MTAPRRRIRSGASWRCRIIATPVRPGTSRRWPTPYVGRSRIPTLCAGSPITPRPSITSARGPRPGSLPRRQRGNELRRLRVPAALLDPHVQSLGNRLRPGHVLQESKRILGRRFPRQGGKPQDSLRRRPHRGRTILPAGDRLGRDTHVRREIRPRPAETLPQEAYLHRGQTRPLPRDRRPDGQVKLLDPGNDRLMLTAGGAAAHLDTHERDVRQAALLVQVVLAGGLHLMATLGAFHRIDLIAWISRLSPRPTATPTGMPRRPIFAERERDSARYMLRGNDLASGQDLADQPPGVRRTQWFSIPEGDHIDD